jgi:hypothetical protein
MNLPPRGAGTAQQVQGPSCLLQPMNNSSMPAGAKSFVIYPQRSLGSGTRYPTSSFHNTAFYIKYFKPIKIIFCYMHPHPACRRVGLYPTLTTPLLTQYIQTNKQIQNVRTRSFWAYIKSLLPLPLYVYKL